MQLLLFLKINSTYSAVLCVDCPSSAFLFCQHHGSQFSLTTGKPLSYLQGVFPVCNHTVSRNAELTYLHTALTYDVTCKHVGRAVTGANEVP